jgi:hypothetical protein
VRWAGALSRWWERFRVAIFSKPSPARSFRHPGGCDHPSHPAHSRTFSRKPFADVARFFAIPLWIRTAVGFALGIIAGLILRERAETWLQPIGDLYLNLIRMVVAPLVLFTIASSIAKLGEGPGPCGWG